MATESAAQAATGPEDRPQAPKRKARPHPKTLQEVWIGIGIWGKSCGHQHLTRQGAVNCMNGGDRGPELLDPRHGIQHRGPGPRRQVLST